MASASPAPRANGEWALFGIPFRVDPSWLVIVALVTWSLAVGYFPSRAPGFSAWAYWLMGGVAALLLFTCVLLHELGHSLAAAGFGIPVTGMVLFIFGGVAQIGHDPRRPSVELAVALAGPVVSVLVAGACFWAAAMIPVQGPAQFATAAIVHYLGLINTWILLFNLLPGFPLDGGRILRAILWAVTGNLRRATRVTALIGSWLGIGLIALGVWGVVKGAWVGGLWYLLLGAFLRNAACATMARSA